MIIEEKIEYLAKAVMTLGELGDAKTASVLNEIRLELKKQVKLPEGLEEAAEKHIQSVVDAAGHPGWDWEEQDIIDAFIAGAEYQRKQDQSLIELAEDHAMLAGMNKMKEEMMEKAEECELYWDGDFLAIDLNMAALGYSERDKVKVIILKAEEK